jgi:hypothetical protein
MAVSETIVREFFELHGFLVHQRRKYVAPASEDDDEADFYVLNPTPPAAGAGPLPFLMVATDLPRLQRAIVVVKGWHTETFSPARLESAPAILRFVEPAIFAQARRFFGDPDTLTKVLIVPTLPQAEDARERTVALLREKGVDAVIPFRIILTELVRRTEPNRNYRKSDLLQVIRILKHYDLLREPQLELFRAGRRR